MLCLSYIMAPERNSSFDPRGGMKDIMFPFSRIISHYHAACCLRKAGSNVGGGGWAKAKHQSAGGGRDYSGTDCATCFVECFCMFQSGVQFPSVRTARHEIKLFRSQSRQHFLSCDNHSGCWETRFSPGGSTLERIQQIELEISRTQKNKAHPGA